MASLKEKKKMKKTPPLVMVVAVLGDEDGSSWDLVKMSLVVFKSFLQRPKNVIFEGLSEEGLVMVVVEKGGRRRRRVLLKERMLERELYVWKMKWVWVCTCVVAVGFYLVYGRYFVDFVLIMTSRRQGGWWGTSLIPFLAKSNVVFYFITLVTSSMLYCLADLINQGLVIDSYYHD